MRFGSFLVAARLTLYQNGQSLAITLPCSYAQFRADRNSAQRRTGELTVEILPTIPPSTVTLFNKQVPFLPVNPTSPLAPFGNEVFVELTVMSDPSVPIGTNGWVPMGLYAIASSTIDDSGQDLAVTLDLYDRSWPFSRWGLLTNYNVPAAGGNLEAEIKALLTYAWNNNGPGRSSEVGGSVPVPSYITGPNFQPTTYTVPPGIYQQGQDPWAACLDMATSAGYELFFDLSGTLAGKPAPGSPAGGTLNSLPVVWGFNPGEVSAQGTYAHPLGGTPFTTPVAASLQMTRDKIYNDYQVSATGPSNSDSGFAQAQAVDSNPNSPTYINSAIGDIPYFVYDSSISGQGQALAEAQYDLAVSISSAWTASVSSPLNPLLDIDDVCAILNPRFGYTGNGQKFIIDTLQTSVRYDVATMVTGRIIQPGS